MDEWEQTKEGVTRAPEAERRVHTPEHQRGIILHNLCSGRYFNEAPTTVVHSSESFILCC